MRGNHLYRYLPLAYVAAVTVLLLALIAEQSSRGPATLPGLAIYALAAGFGLEFVSSVWVSHCGQSGDARALRD